ncbi:MAG: transcriptional repressor [Nitrospinae bacterium]|nr:transcriptional repressor [Nitrospinota bacterium]
MNKNERVEDSVERFKSSCLEAGLKLTHQRIEIYRELASIKTHPNAETLYKQLKKKMPTISLDTVYRNLSLLSDYGLIRRLETAESQARFDGDTSRHYHAICSKCKEIVDFDWEEFNGLVPPNLLSWGRPKDINVVVCGVCSKCIQKKPSTKWNG